MVKGLIFFCYYFSVHKILEREKIKNFFLDFNYFLVKSTPVLTNFLLKIKND